MTSGPSRQLTHSWLRISKSSKLQSRRPTLDCPIPNAPQYRSHSVQVRLRLCTLARRNHFNPRASVWEWSLFRTLWTQCQGRYYVTPKILLRSNRCSLVGGGGCSRTQRCTKTSCTKNSCRKNSCPKIKRQETEQRRHAGHV